MIDERDIGLDVYNAEAEVARARIGETIDRIQAKVAPSALIAEASEAMKKEVSGGVRSARRSLQRHPVAVGVTGGVLGLLAIRSLTK
ncbi:MAG: hypothetical protein WA979_15000 [Pacificimonas sp.]